MDIVFSFIVGIALSAACGFRVFVPLLVAGIAQRAGHLAVTPDFAWLGSTTALIGLGAATLVEIAGYYVPWVDNALDTIATPAAVVAGIILTGAMVSDVSPFLRWTLAVVAGGGAAGVVQATTVFARAASSTTTGGIGNPVVSTLEMLGSVVAAVLALLAPFIALGALLLFVWLALRFVRRWRARRATVRPA